MSPPIRDGSGNSIGSVRLGDGTEISEVRTGAGDVLFSAAPPIPDSGLAHHYDLQTQSIIDGASISTLTDLESNKDLSGTATATTSGINNNDSADYDGVDDEHTDSSHFSVGGSNQYTALLVVEWQNLGDNERAFQNGASGSGLSYYYNASNDAFRWQHDGQALNPINPGTTSPQIIVASYDGSELVVDVNGQEQINTSVGFASLTGGVSVGSRIGSDFKDILLGELAWYDTYYSSSLRDELTNYAADRWETTI